MKVNHIGYAVKDIEKAIASFASLGYVAGEVTEDEIRHVKIAFLRNGPECVELVAPNGDGNPVDGILKKSGPSPYHICYEVEDLDAAVEELTSQRGWMLTKRPEIAPAFGGHRVAFLYQRAIGTFELVEMQDDKAEE